MKDEALRLALEALEGIHPGNMTPMAEEYWNKAITAIKQALAAQPAVQGDKWVGTVVDSGYGYKVIMFSVDTLADIPHGTRCYVAAPAAQPAPVQGLPFGVGGGLVAIKTLLSRDPCVHANTAIEMIDAILKEHPAAQPAVQEPFGWWFIPNGEFLLPYEVEVDDPWSDARYEPMYKGPPPAATAPNREQIYKDAFDQGVHEGNFMAMHECRLEYFKLQDVTTPPAAQPAVQEPVAWRWTNGKGWLTYGEMQHDRFESTPLYTTPPAPAVQEPVPLTDEQIDYSIKKGDIVVNERWSLTELTVVDVNWALSAVAVQLGQAGGIVVWPATSLKKAVPTAPTVQEPMEVDQATMELAESVGLIGPTSRTHDLHCAIQRFHDLICVNATIKAAKMAADAIRESTPPAPAVPDALNPKDENPAYAAGWNDCRQAMMEMKK